MKEEYKYGYFIVICIEEGYDTLTKGKEYKVGNYNIIEQGSIEERYIITNDDGYSDGYYSDIFKRKNISEIRDNKLKELGL